jgi:large subunit ribosomal protein L18
MRVLAKQRRAEGKTNYTKRRRLLEGKKSRIVIRKTNRYVIIQYVKSSVAQDTVVASANSRELLEYGWLERKTGSLKSLGAAYLAGFLFGHRLKKLGLDKEQAILDTGLIRSTKGSRVYSAVKGIMDAKIKLSCNPEVFPEEKRIRGENIKEFFDKVKENIEKKSGAEK